MTRTQKWWKQHKIEQWKHESVTRFETHGKSKTIEIFPLRDSIFSKIPSENIGTDWHTTKLTEEEYRMEVRRGSRTRIHNHNEKAYRRAGTSTLCKRDCIVTSDAIKTGLGITLWQKQLDGEMKSIAIRSRFLNDTEKVPNRRIRTASSCSGIWQLRFVINIVKERADTKLDLPKYLCKRIPQQTELSTDPRETFDQSIRNPIR